jgi:acyl carrier protein
MVATEQELRDKIRAIMSKVIEVPPAMITDDAHLVNDLKADSLMALEILVALEKTYQIKIPEEKLKSLLTLGDAVALMRGLVQEAA